MNSKIDIRSSSVGIGAVATFLGLYLGFVFLISGAAILALKALSDSLDSRGRYHMLRQLGAEEKAISKNPESDWNSPYGRLHDPDSRNPDRDLLWLFSCNLPEQ